MSPAAQTRTHLFASSVITHEGLRTIGFEPLANGQTIEAEFHLLRVFSVRGLVMSAIAKPPPQVFQGIGCRFAFGDDLNSLGQSLVGDNLADDQEEWCKEKKANAPFLVVHIGPTPSGVASSGFSKQEGDITITYDAFPDQRARLAATEGEVIAPLIASLSLALSGRAQPVQLLPVAREAFGKTPDGTIIHDIRILMSGSMYVSTPIDDVELNRRAVYAEEIRRRLREDIGQFYYIGLIEEDPLKRFLFFFLFLERYTHSVFQRIVKPSDPGPVFSIPPRLAATGARFARAGVDSAKSLMARFVWCSLLAWPDVTDDDVKQFKELKRERDRLSHGDRMSVDAGLANRARDLGARLLRAELPFIGVSESAS